MADAEALLAVARELAQRSPTGRPKQARLRRAESTAYYAVFHALMRAVANEFVGASNAKTQAWIDAYRSLDHADIRKAAQKTAGFGPEILQFVRLFGELQSRRHAADYDPSVRLTLSETLITLNKARSAMDALVVVSASNRRAFLATLIFGRRR
jgi:uncharacterized protein (UPF0332 family)